ncbi:MAG: hypothetical protein KJ578_12170, partial [Bacteroidetes bacterium]|nr:hypothetical protein [Bacteroidota bacterium]
MKSVSGKTKNPWHKFFFLSFDWAKDQTLYGKDGLRALPESRKFNEGVGFFKAQMPFSGPFMN